MRLTLDFDRIRSAAEARIPDGPTAVRAIKKTVLGGYIRTLERMDPAVAANILGAQREFFAAGRAFFESEMNHAAKAEEKFRARVPKPVYIPVTIHPEG